MITRAPSNIALIKYMGKEPGNLPVNQSLSLTLNDLCTFCEVIERDDSTSVWSQEKPQARGAYPLRVPKLSDQGERKVLEHVDRVRRILPEVIEPYGLAMKPNLKGLTIKSANTFPHGSGIASSASSFAALTLAVAAMSVDGTEVFQEVYRTNIEFRRELAKISRQGSGSSCRSFEGPWVQWADDKAERVEALTPVEPLSDLVLIVNRGEKEVGSSEAHRRVRTSPHWEGRVDRVNQRVDELKARLVDCNWNEASRCVWEEFRDMHGLFETSDPSFSYILPETEKILEALQKLISESEEDEVPLVTMDAGPNVHVLIPSRLENLWRGKIERLFPMVEVLEDQQGHGAEIVRI